MFAGMILSYSMVAYVWKLKASKADNVRRKRNRARSLFKGNEATGYLMVGV